ncbi:C40 family peptidase [Variovorax sp. J22R24]|uniref:C40 family peptidase n=1 Tax=Variovorax gracilis TaxID=3053502 RepID=UPI002575C927|nr:C40 family peptidase [Variovorax sp. J22R24]MDM0107894.1 C40 family peptidase [Variovorax sp. J22R24]
MLILRRSITVCAWLVLAACSSTAPLPVGRSARPSLISAEQSRDAAIHAMGLVGTPYRYGGNTVDGGFDCSGLIAFVYRESAGLATPRTVAQLAGFGDMVSRDALRTGDLVIFGGNRPTHAGIYVGENRFVHAPSTGGEVRLDRIDGPYWSRQRMDVRRP